MENIPCHLVFFTPAEYIGPLTEWRKPFMDRTVFVPFDLNNAAAIQKYGYSFWEQQFDLDQEYDFHDKTLKIHSPQLYIIWYEKKEFVLRAIELNPFKHNKFLWADAGGFRVKSWYPLLQKFPLAEKIPDKKFFILSIKPFSEDDALLADRKEPRIGGGYLAAPAEVWKEFSKSYDIMLNKYKEAGIYAGKDQNIIASMYLENPDFFALIPSDLSSEDPWFWPQVYFSAPATPAPTVVTVLIPLYNGIEFLNTSLLSVINQTYTHWKVLIGINGHPPNSEIVKLANAIATELCSDGRVQVVELSTKGKPASLNAMMKMVTTDWVAILDVDDIWLPTKLEQQIPFINEFDVIGTNCQYFGNMTGSPNIPVGDISTHDFFSGNPLINSSILLRSKFVHYKEDEILDDYELWLRLRYKESARFYNISAVLIGHRVHYESTFNYKNINSLDEFLAKYKTLYLN